MKIIVSEEIESVCPTFVGACVEANVVNTPYCQELWDEIHALGEKYKETLTTESLKEMGIEPQINGGGGGMDGNIFNQKGITCVGIATGYFKNHSTEEYLHLDDFYHAGELVARIIGRIA